MNEIVNKFLLARDRFISQRHLKQPGFTYNVSDYSLVSKSFKDLQVLQ